MRVVRIFTLLSHFVTCLAVVSAAQTNVQLVTNTERLAWTPSADDADVASYVAYLYKVSDVALVGSDYLPKDGTLPALLVDQGKPAIDSTNTQSGPALKPSLVPGVTYVAFLRARTANDLLSGLSNSSGPFTVLVAPDVCSSPTPHGITLIINDWNRSIPVGSRGRVLWQLQNSFPIVQLQIKMNGQVIAQIDGTDLRDNAGSYFSVPRTLGSYPFTVFAKDTTGCTMETTTARQFIVF